MLETRLRCFEIISWPTTASLAALYYVCSDCVTPLYAHIKQQKWFLHCVLERNSQNGNLDISYTALFHFTGLMKSWCFLVWFDHVIV